MHGPRRRMTSRPMTWLGCAIVAGGLAATSSAAQSPTPPPRSPPDSNRAAVVASADADTLLSAHIAAGDRAHTAMNAGAALTEYENALAIDSANYAALYKAAREAVDLGEFDTSAAARTAYYAKGLTYARRAVAADSKGADGHIQVARAQGRQALSVGSKARIQYAKNVRAEPLKALPSIPPPRRAARHGCLERGDHAPQWYPALHCAEPARGWNSRNREPERGRAIYGAIGRG